MRAQVVFCLVFASVHAAPAAAGPSATPFESRRPGEVVVPVALGARGPFRFLLDTGSTHSAVTPALAAALRLRPVARTSMAASGGTVECLVVALPPLAVGPAVAEGLTATALPVEAAATLGRDVDGILGQDFLARFGFTIDYVGSRIRWHVADSGGGADGQGIRLALVPSQDRFVVELPQRGDRRPLRLVPDSGADTLVLYGEALAGLVSEWAGAAVLGSPTGSRLLRTGVVDGLRVGAATLDRQPAVVLPAVRSVEAAAPDGLLPLHVFASVEFNAPQRVLVVRPR